MILVAFIRVFPYLSQRTNFYNEFYNLQKLLSLIIYSTIKEVFKTYPGGKFRGFINAI